MKLKAARVLVAALVATLALAAGAQAQLKVVCADGTLTTLTAAQIAALPHTTISVKDHDTPAQFEGVPLAAVLILAGVQLGNTLRGPRMAEALLVEAADGDKAVFALAEVDSDFAQREILLADKRDGKPFDAKEGPLRIAVPGNNSEPHKPWVPRSSHPLARAGPFLSFPHFHGSAAEETINSDPGERG